VDRDRDNKLAKPSGTASAQDSEDAPLVGPHNPALGEIYQRLYPEMKRPKPNQEAIAAALQAMQRLTMEADSENAAEDIAPHTVHSASTACRICGHHNREGNKFCGMCGLSIEAAPDQSSEIESPALDSPRFESPSFESSALELPDFARGLTQTPPQAADPTHEVHPSTDAPTGAHHYHHHYHHHYFQGGQEFSALAPRANAPESAREADRLRVAAAAKGEPMSRGEAAVRRLTQEWVLACNTRQLDELIELYAADALVLRSNLPLIRGAAAVREFFFSALESGLGEVAVEPLRVEVVGDLAHEVGRYSALVPGTAGKRREERGKYFWVFAKQSGGDWKLASECWSSDLTLSGAESDVPKPIIPLTKAQPRKG
jgi:ketosteroid isomerase-like protein